MSAIFSICIGAAAGALFRWWLGLLMNGIFPTIPLGTLMANLIGGLLMGIFMALMRNHAYIPESVRLAITTGFLGGLTTFSTFSAEAVTLLAQQEVLWFSVLLVGHVAGTIGATVCGMYLVKLCVGAW